LAPQIRAHDLKRLGLVFSKSYYVTSVCPYLTTDRAVVKAIVKGDPVGRDFLNHIWTDEKTRIMKLVCDRWHV